MDWMYNNSKITEVSQFPINTFGFVYKINHIPSNKAYIGKKVLVHHRKTKLTKKDLALYENHPGRKPKYKVLQKESDWLNYYGSNKNLKLLVESEPPDHFERYIMKVATTKKLLTYYETQYQFLYRVLEKPDDFFNDNILGKFFKKDFDPQ